LVDFFFVLSGFVLTHAYLDNSQITAKKFVITRGFRLVPLHLFILAIFLFLETIALFASDYGINLRAEAFSGKNAVSEIIPNLLLIHAWTDFTYSLSFNGPSWSISVEMFLYILFFATLLLKREITPLIWITLTLLSAYFYISGLTPINSYLFRGIFSFFLGGCAYLIYQRFSELDFGFLVSSFIELSLITLVAVVITQDSQYRFLASGLFFTLVVFFFAYEKGAVSRALKTRALIFIGALSYSIYMTHYLILSLFKSAVVVLGEFSSHSLISQSSARKTIDLGSAEYNSLASIVLIIIIIYISSISFRLIEKRGINLGRRLSKNR